MKHYLDHQDLVVKKALGSLDSLTVQDHLLSLIELWDLGTTPKWLSVCMHAEVKKILLNKTHQAHINILQKLHRLIADSVI